MTAATQAGPTLDQMLATGATYRKLDYWVRKGWLCNGEDAQPGTGYHRHWSDRDRLLAWYMVTLTNIGIAPNAAAEWAREAVDHDNYVQHAEGLRVEWDAIPPWEAL